MKNNMKILSPCMLFALLITIGCSSNNTKKKQAFEIPQNPKHNQHQVMVLGSFHFDRSGNGSDVIGKNHLDIRTAKNQDDIQILTQQIIEHFDPTIIAVEFMPQYQNLIDSLYQSYRSGEWNLGKNEAFQLGFRIAQTQGHERVYCVDNRPIQPQSVLALDDWENYADSIGHTQLMTEYDSSNAVYNHFLDSIQMHMTLPDYLHLLNSPENISRNKELWFAGLVNLGHGDNYVGADLTGHWYQRNTRIFVNIRNLAKTKNERVLIIYGAAHKWVLDEIFNGSPEFKVLQPSEIVF